MAATAFGVLALAALSQPYRMREPDPYAYRAATRALEQGELTLDTEGYIALDTALIDEGDGWARQLRNQNPTYVASSPSGDCPQRTGSMTGPLFGEPAPIGIAQWVRLADGSCVSEKSPGYPFLIVGFDASGLLRLGPLLYGAIGCLGLWLGARRWLGPWGAAFTVGLACSAPASILMAHRAWMPTFTDAFLLAGAFGYVLWAVLAVEARWSLRGWVGALGFLLAGLSVTARLTNALPAVLLALWALVVATRPRADAGWRLAVLWLAGAVPPALGLVAYNARVYGELWASGYVAGGGGPVWSFANVGGNLAVMPGRLLATMPLWSLALVAVVVAVVLACTRRPLGAPERPVGPAGVGDRDVLVLLVTWWLSVWGLYALFAWTFEGAPPGSHPIISARFYLPAIGAMALLGAWLLVRLPAWVGVVGVAALLVAGTAGAVDAMQGGWLFKDEPIGTGLPQNGPPGGRSPGPAGPPTTQVPTTR